MKTFRFFLAIVVLLGATAAVRPQGFGSDAAVKIRPVFSEPATHAGSSISLAVVLTIGSGFHINSHKPSEEFLIPTVITLLPAAGLTFGELSYPAGENKKFSFSPDPLSVYEKQARVTVPVAVAKNVKPGEIQVAGSLQVQACNDQACFAPANIPFTATLKIVDASVALPSKPAEAETSVEEPAPAASPEPASSLQTFAGAQKKPASEIEELLTSKGFFIGLLFIYLAGLALNLTPCVYPLIPVTIGYFAGTTGGKVSRTFGLALLYVLGMAVTYSMLGVVAAMTGSILGSVLQNPIVLIGVAVLLVGLALSLFGLFEFRLPHALTQFVSRGTESTRGAFGAFVMGLAVGFVAAPCVGPFVVGLLTYVGTVGKPMTGFWMFFTLALGLGTPFLVLATFSGALNKLPRSGDWMISVRKIFGVALIALAIYFVKPLLGAWFWPSLAVVFLLAGVFFIFSEPNRISAAGFKWFLRAVGAAAIALGVYGLVPRTPPAALAFQPYSAQALVAATQSGKPVLLDFAADWCLPCHELDEYTFSHQEVRGEAARFVAMKVDLTQSGSDEVKSLMQQFQIHGVPTILLVDKNGQPRDDLRFEGFIPASTLAEAMRKVR